MRAYSLEVSNMISEGRAVFYQTARFTFKNGKTLDLEAKDFYMDGNDFGQGAGQSSFPLGVAIAKTVNLTLVNTDERYDQYDFYMAHVELYCNCLLDSGNVESWRIGEFVVTTPETYGDAVVISAIDYMYKADVPYESNLGYPATLQSILLDSCDTLGITLSNSNFANSNFVINTKPEDITHRELWGHIAMLAGGNAVMDEYNRLKIKTWETIDEATLNGGNFEYKSASIADGGSFSYSDGDNFDGGNFTNEYHVLYRQETPRVDTDDVIITGVQMTVDKVKYLAGAEGYVLSVTNPLVEDKPQEALDAIASVIGSLRFRVFEVKHIAFPFIEVGDKVYVADRKGNFYASVVTDYTFTYFGVTTVKCSADSPLRNSSKTNSGNAAAIIAAKNEAKKQITAYDSSVQQLTQLMSNSFGIFKTEEKQADGSVIYYLHNKPTLDASNTIWKMTNEAFAVSTNGGKTWNAGFDSEGKAVVNVLSAVGIRFDWAKGGELSLGGDNNINGSIKIYDRFGRHCGTINNTGITVFSPDNMSQVIMSPDIGFIRRDADGNEYYGVSHRHIFHPTLREIDKSNLVIGESDGEKIYQKYATFLTAKRYCTDTDNCTTNWELKNDGTYLMRYYGRFSHYKAQVITSMTAVRDYHKNTDENSLAPFVYKDVYEYTYQLPNEFKGKNISVIINAEYDINAFDDNYKLACVYADMTHPKCAGGMTKYTDWFDSRAGESAYEVFEKNAATPPTNAPESPYIDPQKEFPESVREQYLTKKDIEITFPTKMPPFTYTVDNETATITITANGVRREHVEWFTYKVIDEDKKYLMNFKIPEYNIEAEGFFNEFIKYTIEAVC